MTGIAVHTGYRVAAMAGPSEVLVSQTVKDLVAGSGLVFEHVGEYELKGVPVAGAYPRREVRRGPSARLGVRRPCLGPPSSDSMEVRRCTIEGCSDEAL